MTFDPTTAVEFDPNSATEFNPQTAVENVIIAPELTTGTPLDRILTAGATGAQSMGTGLSNVLGQGIYNILQLGQTGQKITPEEIARQPKELQSMWQKGYESQEATKLKPFQPIEISGAMKPQGTMEQIAEFAGGFIAAPEAKLVDIATSPIIDKVLSPVFDKVSSGFGKVEDLAKKYLLKLSRPIRKETVLERKIVKKGEEISGLKKELSAYKETINPTVEQSQAVQENILTDVNNTLSSLQNNINKSIDNIEASSVPVRQVLGLAQGQKAAINRELMAVNKSIDTLDKTLNQQLSPVLNATKMEFDAKYKTLAETFGKKPLVQITEQGEAAVPLQRLIPTPLELEQMAVQQPLLKFDDKFFNLTKNLFSKAALVKDVEGTIALKRELADLSGDIAKQSASGKNQLNNIVKDAIGNIDNILDSTTNGLSTAINNGYRKFIGLRNDLMPLFSMTTEENVPAILNLFRQVPSTLEKKYRDKTVKEFASYPDFFQHVNDKMNKLYDLTETLKTTGSQALNKVADNINNNLDNFFSQNLKRLDYGKAIDDIEKSTGVKLKLLGEQTKKQMEFTSKVLKETSNNKIKAMKEKIDEAINIESKFKNRLAETKEQTGRGINLLPLFIMGQTVQFIPFIPSPLKNAISGYITLISVAKWSPDAANILLKNSNSINNGLKKMAINKYSKKAVNGVINAAKVITLQSQAPESSSF